MKKVLSFILVLMLAVGGSTSAFAATDSAKTNSDSIPTDVKGTSYENAVRILMEKNILSGYKDGTFRPSNTMERAEACAVVVKAMNPLGADLYNAQESQENKFTDMKGYEWALKYVNYAVSKGVVSGQKNNTFNPSGKVTYNEMAAMLVNAIGYTSKDLTGTWPNNYVNKAKELGIFSGNIVTKNGEAPATRGDVAVMSAAVVDKIATAHRLHSPVVMPISTDGAIDNGDLNNYTGRVYGMILSAESSVGKTVRIEFLVGNTIYHLTTDGLTTVPEKKNYLSSAGSLYCLKMKEGIVTAINTDGSLLGADHFEEYTDIKAFEKVTGRTPSEALTFRNTISMSDSSIFYVAQFNGIDITGYTAGSISDVSEGCLIRAFDLTDDGSKTANVVIVISQADAAKVSQ